MAYWVYEHWAAEQKAVIHAGQCGYCKDGNGCHVQKRGNKNGKWHGPFETGAEAELTATLTRRPIKRHACLDKL